MKLASIMCLSGWQKKMPPTRGHDLKQTGDKLTALRAGCPPHGGTT